MVRVEELKVKIPEWYRRHHAWARSVGPRKMGVLFAIVGTGIASLIMTLSTIVLGKEAALDLTLDILGWMMVIGLPVAGLDAWAAGLLHGQKILPWVRLVLLAGVGVVSGAYLLLNY